MDAVDLALPHDMHRDVAVGTAEAGKHIMIEKPLARNLEEADQAPELLARAKEVLGGAELYPYETPVTDVRDAVKAGRHFYDRGVHAICAVAASWFEDTTGWNTPS